VYQQLGISDMPLALEAQPGVQTSLDQLSHEPCYRNAIVDLADALLDGGYPRDADTSLTNFAQRCGASDEILYRRYKALFRASDFPGAARIAGDLVNSNPANAQVRYWRGNAYEQLGNFSNALTDYINSIQLLGEPASVDIDNFYDVSRMYAALKRYCDAIILRQGERRNRLGSLPSTSKKEAAMPDCQRIRPSIPNGIFRGDRAEYPSCAR
jgi:tetratricopeptide (TPR) repeat protein